MTGRAYETTDSGDEPADPNEFELALSWLFSSQGTLNYQDGAWTINADGQNGRFEFNDTQNDTSAYIPQGVDGDITGSGSLSDTRTNIADDGTQVVTDVEEIDFATRLNVTDDGDGTVTVDYDDAQAVVDNPDLTGALEIAAGDSFDMPVRVPDGSTLEVFRWGAYLVADGTAPAGLTVELLDGTDTSQASQNTPDASDPTTPVASYANSSGSVSVFKLRVSNATGTDYTTDGIAGQFGWVVA